MKVKRSKYAHAFPSEFGLVLFNSLTMEVFDGNRLEMSLWEHLETPGEVDPGRPEAKALLDSQLLVPSDLEEGTKVLRRLSQLRRESQSNRDARIGYLRISLTERCNLACSYCFAGASSGVALPQMSQGCFGRVFEWFIGENLGNSPAIQYFGGEPTLEFELIRFGNEMLRTARENGRIDNFSQMVVTNGTLLDCEACHFLVDNDIVVTCSIDGWKEINDHNRVFLNGAGSFDATLRGIENYRKAGGLLRCLVTVTPKNVLLLPDIVRYLIFELSAAEVGVNAPQPTPDGWEVDGGLLACAVQQAWLFCNENGVCFHAPGTHIVSLLNSRTPQTDRCFDLELGRSGPNFGAYVSASGKLSFCTVWHNDTRCTEDRLTSIREYPRIIQWHYPYNEDEECDTCVAGQLCGGPCSLEMMLNGGRLNRDRCRFFRAMVPWVLQR
jgi:uncharacterized protein